MRRALIATGIVVALAVPLVGGTAAYALGSDVPRGTSVLGIDIGGRDRPAAAQALRAGLVGQAERLARPVPVTVGGQAGTIQPGDVSLAVDIDATVTKAAVRPNPVNALFGSRTVDPVVTVNPDRLAAALAKPAAKVVAAGTAAGVRFDGTTPKPVYAKPGKGLDPQRSAQAVVGGWLRQEPVVIPVVDLAPATTTATVDKIIDGYAKPAVAAPVIVRLPGGTTLTVPPQAIARSLVLTADKHGTITPKVDEGKLRGALKTELASTGGQQVDTAALARDLVAVLPKPSPRTVTAVVRTTAPTTNGQDLAQLGIREQVSSFTTHFTGGLSSPRSHNIVTVAQKVDGAVVQPGETFSLNGFTGPRGYAEGYKDAPILVDGKLVPGVGGGISQFTTTLFNATYYAGLEDVHHQPHGFYFARYPSVIESTIFYPTLDFQFRNDSADPVLIDTSYTGDSITVSIWGTKRYDVSTVWSPRRDIEEPETKHLPAGPSCIATEGSQG
ncbi:MAG TPA: VanW family protein, partial [Micromonosporaceae bacterium]|nr:VanW family protein [Micromonosporaceae bacterium]